jgi:hypothetical protein
VRVEGLAISRSPLEVAYYKLASYLVANLQGAACYVAPAVVCN